MPVNIEIPNPPPARRQKENRSQNREGTPTRSGMKVPQARPRSAKPGKPMQTRQQYRPMTAGVRKQNPRRPTTGMRPGTGYKAPRPATGKKKSKKSDPVARYQSMQNSWKSSKFLRANKGTKQGRKLDLAGFNQWKRIVQTHNKPTKKPQRKVRAPKHGPTEDRRDDMRFHLRAKLSQPDYCDRDLKYFHYQSKINRGEKEEPEPIPEMEPEY